MVTKVSWKEWTPNLHNDHLTMAEVQGTLPGNEAMEIHWLVRLLENPKSKFALSGAIELCNHDCIHILLGRGLLAQDEAFVIGFTMGAASKVRFWERSLFRFAARFLYPKIYRLNKQQLRIFDLAFYFARRSACRDVHLYDFKANEHLTLGQIRRHLRIDVRALTEIFRTEQSMLPGTKCSKRLDTQGFSVA